MYSVVALGDKAVLAEFTQRVDLEANVRIQRLAKAIQLRRPAWLRDVVPALGSLALHFDRAKIAGGRPPLELARESGRRASPGLPALCAVRQELPGQVLFRFLAGDPAVESNGLPALGAPAPASAGDRRAFRANLPRHGAGTQRRRTDRAADHQTTGGYPKIAEVAGADVPNLAQVAPGESVRFVKCSLEAAHTAEDEGLGRFRSVRDAVLNRLSG
jgi:hypothetical protein